MPISSASAGLVECGLRYTYRGSIDRDRTRCQLKSVPKANSMGMVSKRYGKLEAKNRLTIGDWVRFLTGIAFC